MGGGHTWRGAITKTGNAHSSIERALSATVGSRETKQQVVTAIARELLGFVWAIGVEVERNGSTGPAAA